MSDSHNISTRSLETLHEVSLTWIGHDSFTLDEARKWLRRLDAFRPAPKPLGDEPLLAPEVETDLFRALNLFKFAAADLRESLDPNKPDAAALEESWAMWDAALSVRDRIVNANVRLVMSIVKNFATCQTAFDDYLSDGMMTLMGAVEKFDFSRGFRFSTYAYRAVTREICRRCTRNGQMVNVREQWWLLEQEEDRRATIKQDQLRQEQLQLAESLVGQTLDRREQFMIRSRYALGPHRKTRSFQCLADKLGISKERVRQLEQRAVKKLRNKAKETGSSLFSFVV